MYGRQTSSYIIALPFAKRSAFILFIKPPAQALRLLYYYAVLDKMHIASRRIRVCYGTPINVIFCVGNREMIIGLQRTRKLGPDRWTGARSLTALRRTAGRPAVVASRAQIC